jgi:hypothetical protein
MDDVARFHFLFTGARAVTILAFYGIFAEHTQS